MKSKSLILMAIAMVCGLAAAYTTAKLTAKGNEETETVLVANTEIKIGTVLKEPDKLFVAAEYKKGTAMGAVTNIEMLKDKIVTRTIRPGNYVNGEDLTSNFGITPPKGTKAMSIKVTPDAAVAGFILPGSRVDVLATIAENEKTEVLTILQNQEVLAVDKVSVRPDGQSAMDVNNVTLAVTPYNAQKLELALRKSGGVVRLLLRDQNDAQIHQLSGSRSLTDKSVDFGQGETVVPRALAANADIPVGTVIDEPERMFHTVPVATLPDRGFLEIDLAKLKGQTVQVPLFKDSVVTGKHFDVLNATGETTKNLDPVRSILFIQNGAKDPQVVIYENGVMLPTEQVNTQAPAPRKPSPVNQMTNDNDKKPAKKPS